MDYKIVYTNVIYKRNIIIRNVNIIIRSKEIFNTINIDRDSLQSCNP